MTSETQHEKIIRAIELISGVSKRNLNDIKTLIEKGSDEMFKIAKQPTDSDVTMTLNDLRAIKDVAEKFRDILYDELQARRLYNKLGSK